MYLSYKEFVINAYGIFKHSFEIYCEYVGYSLAHNYDYFGKTNKNSLRYNYNTLTELLALNRPV
jgi:hypothetical protein